MKDKKFMIKEVLESDQYKEFLDNVKSNTFVEMNSDDYNIIRDLKKAKDERKKKS